MLQGNVFYRDGSVVSFQKNINDFKDWLQHELDYKDCLFTINLTNGDRIVDFYIDSSYSYSCLNCGLGRNNWVHVEKVASVPIIDFIMLYVDSQKDL